jgi:hypothetical protein
MEILWVIELALMLALALKVSIGNIERELRRKPLATAIRIETPRRPSGR